MVYNDKEQRELKVHKAQLPVSRGRSWPAKGALDRPKKRAYLQVMYTNHKHTDKWTAGSEKQLRQL